MVLCRPNLLGPSHLHSEEQRALAAQLRRFVELDNVELELTASILPHHDDAEADRTHTIHQFKHDQGFEACILDTRPGTEHHNRAVLATLCSQFLWRAPPKCRKLQPRRNGQLGRERWALRQATSHIVGRSRLLVGCNRYYSRLWRHNSVKWL